ncbi:clathrin assembly protein [Populus alba x Populus x berolinensis]|nr:clathrin assembly protein [Populus alba x Populus x berolinensis]
MHKRFRQVFCALKEHTSVSYAKIATFGGFCDVDLMIVKATAPDDLPLPEKYMHELVKIFSFSNSSFHSFSLSFTRRFGNTRSWKGSLKCLILIHRLLSRDDSSSNPEAYTVFIRSYAQLLDQALDCFSLDNKETEEEVMHESLQHKIKQVSRKLELLPRLQSLIDRVLDCIPTGVAPRSLIVQQAMKHIIRDRFICYTTFRREIVLVLDNLLEMPYRSCVSAFDDDQEKQVIETNTLIKISSQLERSEENGCARV